MQRFRFRQEQVEWLVRYVMIPLGGLGLALLLALLPGERPSLVFLAVSMMGIPWVAGKDKGRQNDAKPESDE